LLSSPFVDSISARLEEEFGNFRKTSGNGKWKRGAMTNPNPQFSPDGYHYNQRSPQPNYGPYQQGQQAYAAAQPFSVPRVSEKAQRTTVGSVYLHMTLGVLLTAVVAYLSAGFGWLAYFIIYTGTFGFIALIIAQLALVIILGARVMKMSPTAARVLFYIYAATMGFTLSEVFFVYNLGSVVLAFGITAIFFFCLTMLALTTKINMLKAGPILMVGLIVLIISQVILMFVNVGWMAQLISALGIIIFAGFTMHDAQATRLLMQQNSASDVTLKRISIICALNLYLDFINLFLYLLRIFGSVRN
jgi:FtsH-binding integral membrane protein